MNTLQKMLQQHFTSNMARMCFIGPDFWDKTPARTASTCGRQSSQQLARFFAKHPALANYQMAEERRIPQRATLFATEVLGSDYSLTQAQIEQKSTLHLLMSVQMTAQWLLDDTLDADSSIDREVARQIIEYYLGLLESGREEPADGQVLQAACSQHGMPREFIESIRLLTEWQRDLSSAVDIPIGPSSIYCRINREVMRSFLLAHKQFDSPESYLRHRSMNCGLSMQILCGAYWICKLWRVDASELERHQDDYVATLCKYSLLGGLSNDLFGYDKDVEEGVATGVEIVKRHLTDGRSSGAEERATVRAFLWLIDLYNDGLTDLVGRCHACDSPLERAVLSASLSTTWAVRLLHHEFMEIYRPRWFRKVVPHLLVVRPRSPSTRRSVARSGSTSSRAVSRGG
jgi:hypothetical protein